MLSVFGLLILFATLPTIAVTSFTGSFPVFGGVAVVAFGTLAILGIVLLYWSTKFGDL